MGKAHAGKDFKLMEEQLKYFIMGEPIKETEFLLSKMQAYDTPQFYFIWNILKNPFVCYYLKKNYSKFEIF